MEWLALIAAAAATFIWYLAQHREILPSMRDAQQWQRHLGKIGDLIIVEGKVVRVDYMVRGNPRRYVISTAEGRVVYEGPALLVGWFGFVRFTATIRLNEYSAAGQTQTLVENARDVVVMRNLGGRNGRAALWSPAAAPAVPFPIGVGQPALAASRGPTSRPS